MAEKRQVIVCNAQGYWARGRTEREALSRLKRRWGASYGREYVVYDVPRGAYINGDGLIAHQHGQIPPSLVARITGRRRDVVG